MSEFAKEHDLEIIKSLPFIYIYFILNRDSLRSSLVAYGVKNLALSLLWYTFDPWSRNFHMLGAWPK